MSVVGAVFVFFVHRIDIRNWTDSVRWQQIFPGQHWNLPEAGLWEKKRNSLCMWLIFYCLVGFFSSALSLFPRMCDVFQGLGGVGRKGTKDKNKVNWHKARIFNSRFTCNHLHTLVRTRDTTTPENLNKLLWCPICMLNTESCYNDCCFGEWMCVYIYLYIGLDAMRNVFLVTAAIQPGQGEDRAGNRAAVWSDALLRPRLLPILHTGHHSRVGESGGGRGGLIYLCIHIWQCPLLAPSVRGPQMVWECVCVCVCVWTEWTWHMHYAGISTHQFTPHYATQATHAHAHPQTIWGQQTNRAKSGYGHIILGCVLFISIYTCVCPPVFTCKRKLCVWYGDQIYLG